MKVVHLFRYEVKMSDLELKTRSEQHLVSLTLNVPIYDMELFFFIFQTVSKKAELFFIESFSQV